VEPFVTGSLADVFEYICGDIGATDANGIDEEVACIDGDFDLLVILVREYGGWVGFFPDAAFGKTSFGRKGSGSGRV
jgi:hypothetical protein